MAAFRNTILFGYVNVLDHSRFWIRSIPGLSEPQRKHVFNLIRSYARQNFKAKMLLGGLSDMDYIEAGNIAENIYGMRLEDVRIPEQKVVVPFVPSDPVVPFVPSDQSGDTVIVDDWLNESVGMMGEDRNVNPRKRVKFNPVIDYQEPVYYQSPILTDRGRVGSSSEGLPRAGGSVPVIVTGKQIGRAHV